MKTSNQKGSSAVGAKTSDKKKDSKAPTSKSMSKSSDADDKKGTAQRKK